MRALLLFPGGLALAALSIAVTEPACVIPQLGIGTDAGASSSSSSSGGAEDSGAAASATVQGASCTQVSSTVALCKYISACPSLVLNAQTLPNCGFYIHGSAIDPECVCGTSLCPVGAEVTTCAEAQAEATGDTTYDSVCEGAVQGRCTALSGGGSSTSSACQQCIEACDNVPSCVDACGC